MNNTSDLKQVVKGLLQEQKVAVLATHGAGQPYTSLVAFAATDDTRTIFFATDKDTRKYANIMAESRVAMLTDNRTNQEIDFQKAIAVTSVGRAHAVKSSKERDRLLTIYLAKYPHLVEFVTSPTCCLVKIEVDTHYIVREFQHVNALHMR